MCSAYDLCVCTYVGITIVYFTTDCINYLNNQLFSSQDSKIQGQV